MDFLNKKVWIIGASSGIGRALAIELAKRGARLILSARNADALAGLKASLGQGHEMIAFDVSKSGEFHQSARVAGRDGIDSIILLAGTYAPSSLAALNEESAREIVDTNLMGAIHCLTTVLPLLRKQGHGQLALCGSVAGYRGLPNAQPYAATKAAIISLAETARAEELKNGIDVRLINPGFVKTPMTDKNAFPMPMMISPEKAAAAIADGLEGSSFEIHFPMKFTLLMKLLKFLPDWLYFILVRRLQ